MVKPRDFRVPIMLSEDELASIDNWRFENRVATRSEAIRRLCHLGLSANATLDRVQETMFQARYWIFDAIDAYLEERGLDLEHSKFVTEEAPEVVQNAAIAAGGLALGLTLLGRTTYDALVLRRVADIERALLKVRSEMPYQKLSDELDTEFVNNFVKLMELKRREQEEEA